MMRALLAVKFFGITSMALRRDWDEYGFCYTDITYKRRLYIERVIDDAGIIGCKVLWHNEHGAQAWVSYYPKAGFAPKKKTDLDIVRCTFPR